MLTQLRDHICLYASFDASVDADLSRGDGHATQDAGVVQRDPEGGRHGGAMAFCAATRTKTWRTMCPWIPSTSAATPPMPPSTSI